MTKSLTLALMLSLLSLFSFGKTPVLESGADYIQLSHTTADGGGHDGTLIP